MLLNCSWISDPFVISFSKYTPSGQAAWECITKFSAQFQSEPDDEATFDNDEEDDDFVIDETGGEGMVDRFLEQDSEDNDNEEEDEN
jgi:hypothetical protein